MPECHCVCLLVAAWLAGCGPGGETLPLGSPDGGDDAAPDAAAAAPDGPVEVDPRVAEELAAHGRAPVVVSLRLDSPDELSDEQRLAAVAEVEDQVLAALPEDGFVLGRRYASIPAFSGTLLSAEALEVLQAHPAVEAVRRDEEIGGGSG
jgi:hypothetical protein